MNNFIIRQIFLSSDFRMIKIEKRDSNSLHSKFISWNYYILILLCKIDENKGGGWGGNLKEKTLRRYPYDRLLENRNKNQDHLNCLNAAKQYSVFTVFLIKIISPTCNS